MEAAMSGFVDFAALKDRAPIEQVVAMLGLQLKPHGGQLRGACPRCGGGDRALVITKTKNLFYCFPSKDGGDQIKLVAHLKDKHDHAH
jgi:DNA primase